MVCKFEVTEICLEVKPCVKRRKTKNKKTLFPSSTWLESHVVLANFPSKLIDSWTCSGCEHETSTSGGEHPVLSAHLSRGPFTLQYFAAKRLMYTAFLLFTHSFSCLHSLPAFINRLCSPVFLWAAACFGLSFLSCCHKHFRWPPYSIA